MKLIHNISKLQKTTILVFIILLVTACSMQTKPASMEIVNQSIKEGRLVPVNAVKEQDLLNLYSHKYDINNKQAITVDITLDRTKVLNTGGEGFVQIALIARSATIKKSKVQFLIYDDSFAEDKKNIISAMVKETHHFLNGLPKGSALTVDTSFKRGTLFHGILQSKKHNNPELIDFVKYYTKQDYPDSGSQFVLVLGDIGKMLKNEKQDVVDMVRILNAKGVRSSVLSYGEKPDFSFYTKLAEVGNGTYRILKDKFDYKKWITNEVNALHAKKFSNLNVAISTKNNMKFTSILSPENKGFNDNYNINFKIDSFSEGDKYIMFAKIKYSKLTGIPKTKILNVKVDYFDNSEKKYKKSVKNKFINYVFDKNLVSSEINNRIQRSNLILSTNSVVADIVPMIKDRRYYNAIALLTTQQKKLNNYLAKNDDLELLRDKNILSKYSQKLYEFDDKWIQFWQINKDLNWDNARYITQYK